MKIDSQAMKYTLMNKNIPVFDFISDEHTIYATSIGSVMNEKFAPLSIEIDDGYVNRKDFNDWLIHRRIPASREQLKDGLENLSYAAKTNITTAFLAEKSFYLSLSDQYWIKPKNSNMSWSDINFFTNSFSDDIGKALFDDETLDNPNLISPCNSSDGVLKKKWQIINNERYLIKSGTGTLSQEVFNEQIANKVCELLGIIDYTKYDAVFINNKPASVCKCFIDENTELITANDILKHFLPNYRISQYEHYVKCCERLGYDTVEKLDEMIIVDYIIGNTDRHYRNFGLIRDVNSLEILRAAPIYDSGTSLCHDIPDNLIDIEADIKSKPFAEYHSEQIKLVSKPEKFEISKLSSLSECCREILKQFDYLSDDRVKTITSLLDTRVKKLDRALCKGYYNGIDKTDTINQASHKRRSR